jgi:tetrahydromethanopterin S-methyltransferase subunit D
MLIIRIVGFLALLSIGGALAFYAITRDRRYLALAGRILRVALFVAAAFMAFYVLERVILVV